MALLILNDLLNEARDRSGLIRKQDIDEKNFRMFHVENRLIVPRGTWIYFETWIINTEISDGETPLMRAACPMVLGQILASFSLASCESEVTLL